MNWIEIPPGRYRLVSEEARESTCQIELDVRYDNLFTCEQANARV